MALEKKNELIVMFLSDKNPLWDEIFSGNDVITKLHKSVQSSTNISNWKKGREITAAKADEVFTNTLKAISQSGAAPDRQAQLNAMVEEFRLKFARPDSFHTYEAASLLSIPVNDFQKIIDDMSHNLQPLFHHIYYPSKDEVEQDFGAYYGLYNVFLKRGGAWLKCKMRVRYYLEIQNGFAIRCKLHIPKFYYDHVTKEIHADTSSDGGYLAYDGFLIKKNQRLHWLFEQKLIRYGDFIYLITNDLISFEGKRVAAGEYNTTDQDSQRSIVTEQVLFERVSNDPANPMDVELMEKELHADYSVILDKDECAALDVKCEQIRPH